VNPLPLTAQKAFLVSCLNASLYGDQQRQYSPDPFPGDWQGIEALAEYHSVAPLVYREVERHQIQIPVRLRQQFKALVLRHRQANRIRFQCLAEIDELLARHDIALLVLKGAALAHLVYDEEYLRPMSDLDLLVPADKAGHAARLLKKLGYSMAHGLHRYNHRPHHLPGMEKQVNGLHVSVELHQDVMSRDSRFSMTRADLREKPQAFSCAGRQLHAFNHTDMLRHLCVHSFSPSRELRLIHLYDIMAYAAKFAGRIKWQQLRDDYPYVINGIRCIHFILSCPDQVAEQVDPPACRAPKESGQAMKPLSAIFATDMSVSAICKELFLPSPWWKHAYYGIRPEDSLACCHLLTHPAMVCRWLWLRALSALHTRLRGNIPAALPEIPKS
jgi:hypothetical protein